MKPTPMKKGRHPFPRVRSQKEPGLQLALQSEARLERQIAASLDGPLDPSDSSRGPGSSSGPGSGAPHILFMVV